MMGRQRNPLYKGQRHVIFLPANDLDHVADLFRGRGVRGVGHEHQVDGVKKARQRS